MNNDIRAISKLLRSASHPQIDQFLQACGIDPKPRAKRYTLGTKEYDKGWGRPTMILKLEQIESELDPITAASYALISACFVGNLKLVLWMIRDLRTIIDINMQINGRGILTWTIDDMVGWSRTNKAINICRALIIYYGRALDANHYSNRLLLTCASNNCADIVMYLMETYGSDLEYGGSLGWVFRCIIMDGQDEIAMQLCSRAQSTGDTHDILVWTVLYGSLTVFKYVTNLFESKFRPGDINYAFSELCSTHYELDRDDKIRIGYAMWKDQLTTETIEKALHKNWQSYMRGENHSQLIHMVVETCLELIQDRGIEIALALCCRDVDLETIDLIISSKLEQIISNPELTRHCILVCCERDDIDTFGYILGRLGSNICADTLQFWCEAGDLEGVAMILDMNQMWSEHIPKLLKSACQIGDADMAQLLAMYTKDSISAHRYRAAFYEACYNSHDDTVLILGECWRQYLGIYSNSDYELCLVRIEPRIIRLLNQLFQTSIDPLAGTIANVAAPTTKVPYWSQRHRHREGYHEVKYDKQKVLEYSLC